MAPSYMMASRRPKFQPRVGILNGRIEKQKESPLSTFSAVLTMRPKNHAANHVANNAANNAANHAVTEQAKQDTFDTVMTDQPMGNQDAMTVMADEENQDAMTVMADEENQDALDTVMTDQVNESIVIDPSSATEVPVLLPHETHKPFKLTEAIPTTGFLFPGEIKGKRSILGRWNFENRVAQALHADMDIINKSHVQGVISPVFAQAAQLVKSGYMWEMARDEEISQEDGRGLWRRFMSKLWAQSVRRWPGRLSEGQFAQFFSVLTEARWAAMHEGEDTTSSSGRGPGLLAQHVSLFLDEAEATGISWANGGEVFELSDTGE